MADFRIRDYEIEVVVSFTPPPGMEDLVVPDIFKADIAGKIFEGLGHLVFDVTLIVVTPGTRGVSLTGGVQPTTESFVAKGFVSDYKEEQIDGSIIQRGDRMVVILGASLPANVVPKPNDKLIAEEKTGLIINVKRDPAGATYECQWR